jgi:tetratricopeptide (TPR) repeat protein
MRIRNLIPALAIIALLAVSALAQTGRIEFDLKNDKGEPIIGAKVEIVRTDIKGNYEAQGDKKGHYLHAGVPFVGRYTILISAPGFAPTYLSDVKPDQPISTVTLNPGDGAKLTIEQVREAQTAQKQGGGQKQMSEAEYKKQVEEYNKKKKEQEDYKARFEEMKKHYEAGQAALAKNDYAAAATEYREAVNLNPDPNDVNQSLFLGNLAIALYNSGVTKINGNQKDAAKQDFADSAQAADKAMTIVKTIMGSDPTKANDAGMKKNLSIYTKSKGDANFILATKYGDAAAAETAAAIYKEAADVTDDPAQKKVLLLKRAHTYREAFKNDEAIAAYKEILQTDQGNIEALYWLGIAYSANEKTWQDSANTLQAFVDTAPDTDPRKAEAKAVIGELLKGNNIQPPKSEKGSRTTRKKP